MYRVVVTTRRVEDNANLRQKTSTEFFPKTTSCARSPVWFCGVQRKRAREQTLCSKCLISPLRELVNLKEYDLQMCFSKSKLPGFCGGELISPSMTPDRKGPLTVIMMCRLLLDGGPWWPRQEGASKPLCRDSALMDVRVVEGQRRWRLEDWRWGEEGGGYEVQRGWGGGGGYLQ